MGGDTTTESPLRGALRDEVRSPKGVVSGGTDEGMGGGGIRTINSGRKDAGSTRRDGGGGDGGEKGEDACGTVQLGECG